MQMAFRSMLESLEPPISAESDWPDVRRAVSLDERLSHLPPQRQVALFAQLKREAVEAERLAREQAASEGVAVATGGTGTGDDAGSSVVLRRPMADGSAKEDELAALRSLRGEQARFPCRAAMRTASRLTARQHLCNPRSSANAPESAAGHLRLA
jgi:hypothetical protein